MTSQLPIQFPTSIDSTIISTFDSCPQKFLMEYVLRRVPIARSIHLHAGGCMASAFERIRHDFYVEGFTTEECLVRAFPHFVKQWGDMEAPQGEYKDFTNCWAAVEAYFREYPMDTDYFQPMIKADGTPAVEFKFAIATDIPHPDTGDPILYSGRADMLASPRDNLDHIYVVDEKTTKQMGSSWGRQWDMRGQFYGYTYAAREYGYNCVGALVRGIAIQQTQFQFAEKPVILTDTQLETWWFEVNKKIRRAVAMYERAREHYVDDSDTSHTFLHGSFDKSFGDACSSYGGCMYAELCTHPAPWLMYRSYEERVWDPLAKDPTANSANPRGEMEELTWEQFMGGQ
jgi:hypothetical protein